MEAFHIDLFKNEILKQAKFAIYAYEKAHENLNSQSPSTSIVWFYLQNFLVSSANVSKLAWGVNSSSSEREPVRQSLGIEENILTEIRKLRNSFEHFDERLNTWTQSEHETIFYMDDNIGPIGKYPVQLLSDSMRHFDQDTHTIYFKGEAFDLLTVYTYFKNMIKENALSY